MEPEAAVKLSELRKKVRLPSVVRRIWERMLTEKERQQIEADDESPDIVDIWMRLRNVVQERAVLDLARGSGLLGEADYEWLLREIGEHRTPHVSGLDWNRTTGELTLDGEVIRKIRSVTVASNICRVLDSFQDGGWPQHIDDPLPNSDPEKLRETLVSLNTALQRIRFRADGTGKGIKIEFL